MDCYSSYYEARQHLNLSELAFEIIENDKTAFLEKQSRQRIINMILRNYMDCADAAIDNALARYREELLPRLLSIPDGEAKSSLISCLVDAYRQELLDTATAYPKGRAFKMQLDKANYNTMMEWKDENGYYEGIPGRFLKAVIEEYARKTAYEREGILLREIIEELQSCIDSHQLVIITLNGPNQVRHEVRPYFICADPGCNYHYLVGMTRKAGTAYPDHVASYRISRINSVKRSHSRSGKISADQIKEIERKLHDDGVQFLIQDSETISVKLTEQGKKMYESQAHLRPLFSERKKLPDGSWSYTFDCTQMQAEFYFFKFGADAIIEHPLELKEKFLSKYRDAVDIYQQQGNVNLSANYLLGYIEQIE